MRKHASRLYIRLKKRISLPPGGTLTLGQASRLLAEPGQEERYKALPLYRHKLEDGNRVVIDVLQIVKALKDSDPGLEVEAYGDPQVLVTVEGKGTKTRIAVLIASWLLLFFGAGLAIMNFHTDVSMKEVHQRISELITGRKSEHPLWFQIPYSLGIGFGMIVFFNHLFKKRFNEEPNPLEVELFMYQENVNAYVIADEMRKMSGRVDGRGDG
ncbi:stage V sporulation protein AA [Paenibacillus beijingensis]|uniref:Stage V sporulation protein AA n=2 Tax=Paenibacillus beijingensis TaxID=1126833 RepID=A0A0D5NRQ0_9BACL|nr:stage V sporulation protein AA [Paenibacillus beijingensis]AJY78019.1 stage V sporulation protein AA [Paenibacillus beijingensis]